MNQHEILIILPALNEEEAIGKVIDEIPKQVLENRGYQVRILVADGNSRDRTRQIAQEKGAEVIVESRRGKGRALRTVFERFKADYVFMLDADYTYPATYIPEMLDILEQGYSVVIGSRLKGKIEKGGMSFLNLVGNHLLTLMANILYSTKISDLCTGYWGWKGDIITSLPLVSDGFTIEAELFINLARKGYKIAEIPIYYRRRFTPPKLKALRDGIKIGWSLITRRLRRPAGGRDESGDIRSA